MRPASPIGVVIATRDRREVLLATLARVTALEERPPIVVVDDGSSDGTAGAVRTAYPGVCVLRTADRRGAAARNLGVERLGTRYAAFLDDDSWWASGALTTAAAALDADPRLALVAARVLVGAEERLDPVASAMARTPLPDGAILGFVACGAIVRRDAFLAVGGFDRRYGIGGEEALLSIALTAGGWRLRYVPEVVAHHHPTPSATRDGRVAQALRNDLWTAWLTRPAAAALRATARALRAAGAHRSTIRGLLGAVRGLPWVARERRPASASLEADLRLLERHTGRAGRSVGFDR